MCLLLTIGCKRDMVHLGEAKLISTGTTDRINTLKLIATNVYVGVGGNTFYRSLVINTNNGGNSWYADSVLAAPKELFGLNIDKDGTLTACGIDGYVLRSGDKGQTWRTLRINNWKVYKSGGFYRKDTGLFVSTVLQRESAIVLVDTECNVLHEQTFLHGLNTLFMTSEYEGYALGYGTVMKTLDGGYSWSYAAVDGDDFTAMHQIGKDLWICGSNGSIFHSADGGANWGRQRNGNDFTRSNYMLRCIYFTDTQHGWAAGDGGKILYTKDGGDNWAAFKPFTQATLRSIAPDNDGALLFAGDGGTVYKLRFN